MTDEHLQNAIESARAWLLPQVDYKTTPSNSLKETTIEHVKKLQEVQVLRAKHVEKKEETAVPLIIEDKYVRNYLWERGLVAVEDRCMRSHPHENMDEYCQHKTNLACLMNKEAQE